jgi:uncharacterized protein YcbK (DUF882 family)
MVIHRFVKVATVLLALAVPALVLPLEAHARSVKETRSTAKAGSTSGAKKVKKGAKPRRKVARRKGRGRGKFVGRGVAAVDLRQAPLPRPSGRVVVRAPGVHDEVDVNIYREDGSFDQAALARLDRAFRCRRTAEERAIDPRLYEILSIIYDRYGKTIELNSGFRYQRNEGSRHFHGSAMDIRIAGVSFKELYAFAQTLDPGGMGMGKYPHSSFVHIDFRAPGEPSYRWTDTQRSRRDPGKAPSKMWKRSARPNT